MDTDPENDVDRLVKKHLAKVPEKDREPVSDWILQKRAEGRSKSTITAYLNWITSVSKMSPKALLDLNMKDVLKLQVKIRDTYKSSTLYSHALRDCLRHHDKEDMARRISLNSKKSKKEWQDPAKVLNRLDVSRMLSVTDSARDRAIVALLWDAGCRVHELTSIQIEDLKRGKNADGKVLYTLWFRKQKVAGEERRVPLYESSKYILQWLRVHPHSDDKQASLFPPKTGKPRTLRTDTVRMVVKDAGEKASIDKPTHPHAFRHGRATDLKMRGVSDDAIRRFMGWVRDSDMPMRYVSRTEQAQMNEVASKLGYEPMPEPGPVEELESNELLPTPEELDIPDERYTELSKQIAELQEVSARNERRFSALLQRFTEPTSEYAQKDPRNAVVMTDALPIDIDRWIDDNVKDCDEEDKQFIKDQLLRFEKERLEAMREAERQWLEQRFGNGE